MWLIDYCQVMKNKTVSVVSETFPHLKRGAMRDFENIMKTQQYWDDTRWNKTDSIYTFSTGTILEFFSADNSGKVHGPRRDILFLNEANNVNYGIYTALDIRTRNIVWLDWNPVSEFWWYTQEAPHIPHDFLRLTYKDNEALSINEVEALERHKHNPNRKNWWRIYGEGMLGVAEGRIYSEWSLVDEVPRDSRLVGYGVDFGYTNDPTAIIGGYKYNEGYILHELEYRKGMSNKQIADVLLNVERGLTIADSAEPKSIDEIKHYGVSILPSPKGRGSVSQGIQFVQDQKISITKTSTNLLKEYRNYLWATDKDGRSINDPIDAFNHAMDAIRYFFTKFMVDDTPKYNPINEEFLQGKGVATPYGGFEGYTGVNTFRLKD